MISSKDFEILKTCEIQLHRGANIPAGLHKLREDVFIKEKAFLDSDVISAYDHCGVHIVLVDKSTDQAIASIQTYKSEIGEFALKSEIPADRLKLGVTLTRLMVRPEYRGLGLGGAMLYLAMQQGRQWGRKRIFLFTEQGEFPTKNYTGYEPIKNIEPFRPSGEQTKLVCANTQRLDLSMSRCFNLLPTEVKSFIKPFLGQEAIDTVSARLDQFFENPWFAAIYNETLTRHQYIQSLANLHQFVRLTTSILARAVSISPDSALRKHFLEHLNGEIDHEVQLENDLIQVGGDVDYVKNHMIPSIPTQQFMVIQESMLAFNFDPLSYIAVPFSIEGFTARLDDRFIKCLENCLTKWGVKRPARGVTFFKLHINSDGGEDGHWENNKKVLLRFIDDELKLQRILNVIHLTMDSLENSYSSYVEEPDFENFQVQENQGMLPVYDVPTTENAQLI